MKKDNIMWRTVNENKNRSVGEMETKIEKQVDKD